MQHLTGHQIATLAQKLRSFCQTGEFCTLVKLHFLVIFALQRQYHGLNKGWKFKSEAWISRLELRLLIVESWYWDWNQDFWNLSLDIKTGIETIKSWVLISRLESRLLRSRSWYRDWYWDSKNRGGSLWSRLSRESLLISDKDTAVHTCNACNKTFRKSNI